MKFNGYENYAMRYYRVKHKKVSVVSFQRILHTKFISIDVTKKPALLHAIMSLTSAVNMNNSETSCILFV